MSLAKTPEDEIQNRKTTNVITFRLDMFHTLHCLVIQPSILQPRPIFAFLSAEAENKTSKRANPPHQTEQHPQSPPPHILQQINRQQEPQQQQQPQPPTPPRPLHRANPPIYHVFRRHDPHSHKILPSTRSKLRELGRPPHLPGL